MSRINKLKYLLLVSFIALFSINVHSQETYISEMDKLKWEKVMPGIWKASFGEQGLNALDYSESPKIGALEELGDAPFPFNLDETLSQLTPSLASIRLPLEKEERIYGLGLEFQGINRRGKVYARSEEYRRHPAETPKGRW